MPLRVSCHTRGCRFRRRPVGCPMLLEAAVWDCRWCLCRGSQPVSRRVVRGCRFRRHVRLDAWWAAVVSDAAFARHFMRLVVCAGLSRAARTRLVPCVLHLRPPRRGSVWCIVCCICGRPDGLRRCVCAAVSLSDNRRSAKKGRGSGGAPLAVS